jgi:Na+-driven multidrug efflux pump
MGLDVCAIALNYLLNPLFIYGGGAVAAMSANGGPAPPGAGLADAVATSLGIEPMGMRGAALATASSRAVTTLVGILILRFGFDVSLRGSRRPRLSRIADIARLSAPVSISILIFAGAYLAVFSLVMADLPTEVKGGLGIGFQVFEGVAFPCYLGVGIAGASLVGRKLGARDPEGALAVVRDARFLGRVVGLTMTAIFLVPSRWIVPWFTQDPAVEAETMRYVMVLAWSQYFVGVETVNEKALLGAGYTRPILWIAGVGNGLRVPLAWLLSSLLGLGALGVWWAINATTGIKALLFWRAVEERRWLTHLDELEKREAP